MKNKYFFIKAFCYLLTFLFLNVGMVYSESVPNSIAFEVVLATQKSGLLTGSKYVIVRIGSLAEIDKRSWTQPFSSVDFINGQASFVLGGDGNPISPSDLAAADTVIQIEVDNLTASFPVPSVPYAIYSEQSKYVDVVDASTITGSFISTLNIQNDVNVYDGTDSVFFVDYSDKKIGIGTSNPQYTLDVDGIVNASNFLIDGQDIESLFSWTKVGNDIFYNKGYVGVGLTNPEYSLDIQGTVNANEYYYKNQPLLDYIQQSSSWKDADDNLSIYFNDGSTRANVGIGTSQNIDERLVVNGGIKLAKSVQSSIRPGTIEYDNVANDFYGYGLLSRKYSLTGLQLKEGVSPQQGDLLIWDDTKTVTSTQNLTFSDGKLSIGTSNASAIVTIQGDGTDSYFEIVDSSNNPIFKVDATGNIGIGKAQSDYELDVQGTIDASGYYINGQPLQTSFSSGSLWSRGRTNDDGTDLYYEQGNVGIGTQTPVNLLELSSIDSSAAITFDVDNVDLYTMGVDSNYANRFVISEGSDLDNPIFVFSSNSIGIGVIEPEATLHVSGNSGFLVEGALDPNLDWIKSGKGTRVFFFPGNSSFRAGTVSGTQWDSDKLGAYSAAFGEDNIASGKYSFVGGGYNNMASGNYSVIPGGKNNIADGDYSFAGGYYASALHDGTFVWADVTSTTNFQSTQPNQFLIRAYGGVGINTNETDGASMSLERKSTGKILNLIGRSGQSKSSFFTSDGKLALGVDDPGDASLGVSGKVGIGTTEPKALLHIENTLDESGYSLYVNSPNHDSSSSSENVLVITSTGNMGIGTTIPQGRLDVRGKIFAPAFIMVDPDDPSNTIQLQNNAGSPWTASDDGSTIYYDKGFVGIGTATPNTLLELSNQNLIGSMPVISFDIDETDFYKMGLIQQGSNVYFTIATSENFNVDDAVFVVTNNSVVIGRGGATSNYSLDVSGNFFIDGKLAVATDNVHDVYDVLIDGSLAVTTLNVNGQDFIPKDSPWITEGNNLYTLKNVGIGLTNPQVGLHVDGTVSVNELILSTNDFELDGYVDATKLVLQDQSVANVSGNLKVVNGSLFYTPPVGAIIELSSPLGVKEGDFSGPLAFWTSDTTVGQMPIFWNNEDNALEITSNMSINNYKYTEKGLVVSTNVRFNNNNGMVLNSSIDHKGNTGIIEGYTLHDYNLAIQTDWGKTEEVVEIKGLDLDMNSEGVNTLYNNSRAIGLYVDVTSVNINAGENASKYAAIFLGGNVGIGKTNPSVALEVEGVISANYFNISDDLTVSKLIVGKQDIALSAEFDNAAQAPRVGIGTLTPNSELDVHGRISANSLLVYSGIESISMNIGSDTLVVNSGNIGIGTALPSASFHIVKELDSLVLNPYIAEKIDIDIDGTTQTGQTFTFNSDLTGLQLELDTLGSTFIQNNTVKGIDIDFTSANIKSDATVYGVYVDVGDDVVSNKYAAVFTGGYVGVGTTQPEEALHVSGDIKANNLILDGSLEIINITINHLVVPETASMNIVTINNLHVLGTLKADSLSIADQLNVEDANFKNITVNNLASLNRLVVNNVSANIFEATSGFYSKSLSIGTNLYQDNQLRVSGSMHVKSLVVDEHLEVPTLTVGTTGLFMGTNGKLGVGTVSPESFAHFVGNSTSVFDIENDNTWNVMKLGLETVRLNQSVGLLFSPENTPSSSIGSGIIAQAMDESSKSDLIFITDPKEDTPKERMRITSEGNVGIGISNPTSLLHVDGTGEFAGSVTINGSLSVSRIIEKGGNGLNLDSDTNINFNRPVSFIDDVLTHKTWGFAPVDKASLTFDSGYGYLYLNESDKDLYFINTLGSEINITAAFTGAAGKIPYFDSSGSIKDDAPFEYLSSDKSIVIGTSNTYTTFDILSSFDADNATDYVAEEIRVTFNRREAASTTRFTGLNIDMESSPGSSETAGRLGDGETAVGLAVDLSDLVHTSSTGTGSKISALFNGGLVGIGTEDPQAVLHVKDDSSLDYDSVFQIDNLDSSAGVQTLFVVTQNNVGIGTSQPEAQLHISNLDSSKDVLTVSTSAGNRALTVLDSGNVGIGLTNPGVELEVNGTVSANTVYSTIVSSNKLVVGDDFFTVDAANSGRIAIGTDNVNLATVSIYKDINENLTQDFVSEKLEVVLNGINSGSQPGGNVYYRNKRNLTGFDITLSSDSASDVFGDTSNPVTAVGVSINLKDLIVFDDTSKAYGLYVETGNFDSSQSRYGAYFGGKVGIGTTNPTVELAVSGSIKTNSLIVNSGTVLANRITANRLYVENDLLVSKSIRVNELIADTISVNRLIAESEIQISTASFDVVTVNNVLNLAAGAKFGIGVTDPSLAFEIVGDSKFNGDVDITNSLSVSSLDDFGADNIITINADLAVIGDVSANTFSTNIVSLVPTTSTITVLANQGQLFVSSNGNDLIYFEPAGNRVNLTNWLTNATAGRLPYFSDTNTYGLLDTMPLTWSNSDDSLTLGDSDSTSKFILNSQLASTTAISSIAAQEINITFNRRVNSSTTRFKGLNIVMQSDPLLANSNAETAGRLGDGETAIGISVDLTQLENNSSVSQAQKMAALFNGGLVGVGTTLPKALLHVQEESSLGYQNIFQVDNSYNETVFVVSANKVGVGLSSPVALLDIKNSNSNDSILRLLDSGNTRFIVKSDGKVGIGKSNPDYELDVLGTITANIVSAPIVSTNKLVVGDEFLTIDGDTQKFMIGTTDTSLGSLAVVQDITSQLTAGLTAQTIDLVIDNDSSISQPYFHSFDITGIDLTIDSKSSNDSLASSKVATGVSINMSDLTITNGSVYGVYVDTGSSSLGGNRYAAYFNGNVGIATLNPTVALDVSGTIKAEGLIVNGGNVVAQRITVNELIVNDDLDVDGNVEVETLIADVISANNVVVLDTVSISTGSFNVVTVNNLLTFSDGARLGVGVSSTTKVFEVNGDSSLAGNVEISGELEVSKIYSSTGDLNVKNSLFVNGYVSANAVNTAITQFVPQGSISSSDDYAQLYSDGNDLIFAKKSASLSTVNITGSLDGEAGYIPHYDSIDGFGLSFDMPLIFDSETDLLQLGSSDKSLVLKVENTISSSLANNVSGHEINMVFQNRNANLTNTFTGLTIDFDSENYGESVSSQVGRLGPNEVAIGLNIDMSSMLGAYLKPDGTEVTARKYSGVFQGGLVGIGTAVPRATLHIASEEISDWFPENNDVFRVDVDGLQNAFKINSLGYVGINDSDPSYRLSIKQQTGQDGLFVAKNSLGNIEFGVSSNAVGIGIEPQDGTMLTVSGSMQVQNSSGTEVFTVYSKKVGIGNTSPAALLDIVATGSDDIFKVSKDSETLIFVDSAGKTTFGSSTSGPFKLNIVDSDSGAIVFSGLDAINPLDQIVLPNELSSSDYKPYGFLAVNDTNHVFLGNVTTNRSILSFGGQDDSILEVTYVDNSKVTTNVMSISNIGVGIGGVTDNNSALFVSGNFAVNSDVLYVDTANVGIGTINNLLDIALAVEGQMMVDSLEVTDSGIKISTLDVRGQVELTDTIGEINSDHYSSLVSVNLGVDTTQSLYGLKLVMQSNLAPDTDEDQYYMMAGNADAYGLYVDMSELFVANAQTGLYGEVNYGNKYAALFNGGPVGIGTLAPEYPLHVKADEAGPIAAFGSNSSDLVIRDFGSGTVAFNVIDQGRTDKESLGIVLKAGTQVTTDYAPGMVGIGTSNPDKSLVVNGDMRLGIKSNSIVSGAYGNYGSKLFFSGGPNLNGQDSENGDALFIARYNESEYKSRMRVNFSTIDTDADDEGGTGKGYDQFVVGYTKSQTYIPVFKVHNNSTVTIWGDSQQPVAAINSIPEAVLHVRANTTNTEGNPISNYVTALENTASEETSSVLALLFSSSNETKKGLNEESKYISFMTASVEVGAIEGNNSGGIRYKTSGADYAEYLEKRDKNELFELGDIVAVYNGKITKDVTKYQQLMVLSSSAAVAGNWPKENKDDFELVSFFGQVQTKVNGRVKKGDFIIPDYNNPGVGIAVSESDLTLQDRAKIVGRAWESSNEKSIKLVNVAVGFAFGANTLKDEMGQINKLSTSLASMKSERENLLKSYQEKIDQKEKLIDELLLRLEETR